MKCDLCDLEVKNNRGLAIHLKKHQMNLSEYLDIKRQTPKCPICKNECKRHRTYFRTTCGNESCYRETLRRRKHNQVTKDILREKRVDYLHKKTGKTAWERRSRKEMSYLESWFQEDVIIKHDLQSRHQIITEHCVKGYFIDFAFLDKMIAVEIDGRCHFDKNMNRREGDFKKDACLSNEGWQVIRMNFFDIRRNPNDLVENFLKVLESGDQRSLSWIGQTRYTNLIEEKNRKMKEDKISQKSQIIQQKIRKLESANIDFSKHGWVEKASEAIEISPQKTRNWLEKNKPEIVEKAFRRK